MESNSEGSGSRGLTTISRSHGRLGYWYSQGKVGWILLWLLGIPIPVLLGLFLLRGCT